MHWPLDDATSFYVYNFNGSSVDNADFTDGSETYTLMKDLSCLDG